MDDNNIFYNKIIGKDEYLDKTCFLNPKYLKNNPNGYDGYNDDYILNEKIKKHLNKIIIITNKAIYGNKITNNNIKKTFKRYLIECVDHIEYEEYNEKMKLEKMNESNKQMTGINENKNKNENGNENGKYYKLKDECDDCKFIIKKGSKKITMDKFVKKKKCEINRSEVSTGFPIIKMKKIK